MRRRVDPRVIVDVALRLVVVQVGVERVLDVLVRAAAGRVGVVSKHRLNASVEYRSA